MKMKGKQASIPKWQRFERLAAALHALKMHGAQVKWNDSINGWQVDVSVRFDNGPYPFLLIVECKDHSRRVEQEDIAAFVTKISVTKANMGVFVSRAGFQSGAIALAAERGIQIFILNEVPADWSPVVAREVPLLSLVLNDVRVYLEQGVWRQLPHDVAVSARFRSDRGRLWNIGAIVHETAMAHWDRLETKCTIWLCASTVNGTLKSPADRNLRAYSR